MARFIVLLIAAFFLYEESLALESINEDLVKYVLERSQPPVIPVNGGTPLAVNLQVGILSIESINTEKNQIDSTIWVSQVWISGISWNPADFNGIDRVVIPKSMIWTPDIIIENTATMPASYSPPEVVIMANGMAGLNDHYRINLACDVDLCKLNFYSTEYNNQFLVLNTGPFNFDSIFKRWSNKGARYQLRDGKYSKEERQFEAFPDVVDILVYEFAVKDTHSSHRHGPSKIMFSW